MKKSMKIMTLVLAVVLSFSLMTCAFAAEKTEENPVIGLMVAKIGAHAAGNAIGNAFEDYFENGGENVGNRYEAIGEKFADEVDAWANGKGAETGIAGFMNLVKQLVSDTTNTQKAHAAAAGEIAPADDITVGETSVEATKLTPANITLPKIDSEKVGKLVDTAAKIGFAALILDIIF